MLFRGRKCTEIGREPETAGLSQNKKHGGRKAERMTGGPMIADPYRTRWETGRSGYSPNHLPARSSFCFPSSSRHPTHLGCRTNRTRRSVLERPKLYGLARERWGREARAWRAIARVWQVAASGRREAREVRLSVIRAGWGLSVEIALAAQGIGGTWPT